MYVEPLLVELGSLARRSTIFSFNFHPNVDVKWDLLFRTELFTVIVENHGAFVELCHNLIKFNSERVGTYSKQALAQTVQTYTVIRGYCFT